MDQKWIKNVTRETTVFPATGVTRSVAFISKILGIKFNYSHYLFVDDTWFYPAGQYNQIVEIFKNKISRDPAYIIDIQKKQKRDGETLKAYVKKLANKKFSRSQIAKELLRYEQKMAEFYTYWWVAIPSGDILEPIVKDILEKNKSTVKFEELMFVRPELELIKEKKQLSQIALKCQKYKSYDKLPDSIKQKLKKHAQQFSWINSSYHIGGTLTASDFFQKLKAENPVKSLKEMQHQRQAEKKTLEKIAKNFSKKEQKTIEAMQAIMYLRNYQKETVNECQHKSEAFLEKVAQELGLDMKLMLAFSPLEIYSFFKKKNISKVSLENIYKKRVKEFAVEYKNKKTLVKDNTKDIKKYQAMVREEIAKQNNQELKGSPACRGHAKGKIRVINNKEEIASFVDGEVLVTVMTSIDYVHIMKRASAIITDEGGITCHAAIFSREFNVPCIIGTKIATKIFKTGDVVEVDAQEGIVRLIKS